MISAWHLLWIVPLSATFGAVAMTILKVGDCDPDWFDNEM